MDGRLDTLNPVERDFLSLLGRGHTAKSIADLRGVSEAAVNERFRSARRKTGIGSSREIARLILAQENRDDFIDLAPGTATTPDLPRQATQSRVSPFRRWSLPMLATGLVAVALFAHQTSVEPSPAVSLPAAAQGLFAHVEPVPEAGALHAEVMAGGVDPAWSSRTETALRSLYSQATNPPQTLASLDVTCSASLCEIVGVSRPDLSPAQAAALTDAAQTRDLNRFVAGLGLTSVLNGFHLRRDSTVPDAATTLAFAAYWRRID